MGRGTATKLKIVTPQGNTLIKQLAEVGINVTNTARSGEEAYLIVESEATGAVLMRGATDKDLQQFLIAARYIQDKHDERQGDARFMHERTVHRY
jgi:hypothetical protein